jgi:hypothetical protein
MKDIKENPRFVTMPQVHPAQVDCLCDVPGSSYMKEIKLTKGFIALVDDEDYDFLIRWKWFTLNSRGILYASRRIYYRNNEHRQKYIYVHMHRLIMNCPNNMFIDHFNHNGLDNRKKNLRIVSHRQNLLNRKDKAILPGAYKSSNDKYYKSSIKINGISKYLGSFQTAQLAHDAYMDEYNKINKK